MSRLKTFRVALCVCLLLTACTGRSHQNVTKVGVAPSVALATSATGAAVNVRAITPPTPVPSYAKGLGAPYEISISQPAAGSTVSFPVDPATDLAPINGYQPSTQNLFISVFEPTLDIWVPLPTKYDATKHVLTAVAPHFSKFWKQVWNGVGDIGSIAKSAVTGIFAFTQQIYDGVKTAVLSAVEAEPQEHADCASADPSYSVTTAAFADKFPGCVATGNADPSAHLENHLLVPYLIKPPTGVVGQPDAGSIHDLGDVLSVVEALALGGSYLPGHGTTSLDVQPPAAKTSWDGSLHLNWPAFAVNVAIGALSVIPADSELTTGLSLTVREEIIQIITEDEVNSMSRLTLEIEPIVEKTGLKSAGMLDDLRNLTDFVDCAEHAGTPAESTVDSAASWIADTVRSCLGNFFDASGAEFASDVTGAINGVFTDIRNLRAIAQAAWNGPSSNIIGLSVAYLGGKSTSTTTVPPSPGPPPDREYTLAVKDGWQYQLHDDDEFTLASTGGGTAGDLHVDTKSSYSHPGLYKDISSGYLLTAGQVGSPSLCSSLLLDRAQYWGTWGPSAPNPLPWALLQPGTQACVDDGGNYEVLTVLTPWNGSSISLDVRVWKCVVPANESVC